MDSIKTIIANLDRKRERQQRALRDTEHHITMLEKMAAQEAATPTPLEQAIAEVEKKGPTRR